MKSVIHILFVLFLFVLFLLTLPTTANAQIAALERFADSSDVSYTYISKTMLKMAAKYGKSNDKGNQLAPIIDKLTGVQEIKTISRAAGPKLINDVKAIARTGKYELLVSIDTPTEQRFVYFKPKGPKHTAASVIIIKSTGRDTKVVGLTGNLDADDLASIIR